METGTLERTGTGFSHQALMTARKKTKEAIALVARAIEPGMLEEDARQLAIPSSGSAQKKDGTRFSSALVRIR
jgi:hypothetical protein